MKHVVIKGERQAEIVVVADPEPQHDWACVKIIAAPMCTEYKQYLSGNVNLPLGHEAAGEVVEVGTNSTVKVGDRVVVMPQYPCGKCTSCNSGEYIHCEHNIDFSSFTGKSYGNATYAQYILKPSWLLPKIPEDITIDQGSMLCCGLGPTFGALERLNVQAGDTVLITGLGPVGLGGIVNGIARGARILGVTNNPYRANLAIELGAEKVFPSTEYTLAQILDYTMGLGVDTGLECAGQKDAQHLLVDVVRRNGKIAFIGESTEFSFLVSDDLIRKGLTLYGIWHYNYQGITSLFDIVRNNAKKINKLITHYFPIDQVKEAWEFQLTKKCGKVILQPW